MPPVYLCWAELFDLKLFDGIEWLEVEMFLPIEPYLDCVLMLA